MKNNESILSLVDGVIDDFIDDLKESQRGSEQDERIEIQISHVKKIKKYFNEFIEKHYSGRSYKIAYLNPKYSSGINHTMIGSRQKIIDHPNVEYYDLFEFVVAFNSGLLSDKGLIAIL